MLVVVKCSGNAKNHCIVCTFQNGKCYAVYVLPQFKRKEKAGLSQVAQETQGETEPAGHGAAPGEGGAQGKPRPGGSRQGVRTRKDHVCARACKMLGETQVRSAEGLS